MNQERFEKGTTAIIVGILLITFLSMCHPA
jgi:hypothetical protein